MPREKIPTKKQGVSKAGFKLLAYIIVNFVCKAIKCPTSRDALAARHQDIFTLLQVRHHLAYAITLVEHHINSRGECRVATCSNDNAADQPGIRFSANPYQLSVTPV